MRVRGHHLGLLLLTAPLLFGAGPAVAPDRASAPGLDALQTPEAVMASLERVLGWYQEARVATSSLNDAGDPIFARDEERTVLHVLQRAFDTARARAAWLAQEDGPASPASESRGRHADQRTRLQAAITQNEHELARLRTRLRTATASTRQALQREAVVTSNRLELERVRLDFITKLQQFDSPVPGEATDLPHQIEALQDAVPELRSPGATPTLVTSRNSGTTSGAWALIHRLLALQRSRSSLEELTRTTTALARSTDAELHATGQRIRPIATRLRALATDPGANEITRPDGEQEFHDLLDRGKRLGAIMLPLREESALIRRYATDIQDWKRAVDREIGHVLQGLAIDLLGVAIALVAIFVGSVLWRFAAVRYVTDAYRRRLLLTAGKVVAVFAIVLVLAFHFTSELAALVTALGFAAAGIAFALQNVILAVAGYFSIVAPNGIRVGDRVSLQGPFGYVHGEVLEIGLVRIRLQELAGEQFEPTGRIVVFPNSVVFTGSFFKHPRADTRSG